LIKIHNASPAPDRRLNAQYKSHLSGAAGAVPLTATFEKLAEVAEIEVFNPLMSAPAEV